MNSEPPAVNKEDKQLASAGPGKVPQNPQPPRNQEQPDLLTKLPDQKGGAPSAAGESHTLLPLKGLEPKE
jgi:hypothetical protein